MRGAPRLLPLTACCGLACAVAAPARGDDPFVVHALASPGRIKAVEIADLDGDGRGDLLEVAFSGLPPRLVREVRVRFQDADGVLAAAPDWAGPLPEDAAAYDLVDLDGRPGSELLVLGRGRLVALTLAGGEPAWRAIALPGLPLMSVWPDERGLDHLDIAREDLGDDLRLLVPLFGETALLSPAGELQSRLAVAGRANYYVPSRSAPLLDENEIELYFDHPRIDSGDVDGDGRSDLVFSNRHEIRVFLQGEDGAFASDPTLALPLGMLSEADHLLLTGSVSTETGDVDGDGRLDLLISHTSGGIFDARSTTRLFLNRQGSWNLAQPDRELRETGSLSRNLLLDLDGDGRVELVHVRVPLGVLESVEILLTSAIDANVALYAADGEGTFAQEPFFAHKLDLAISLERQTSLGFIPTLDADLNGDGVRDLLDSGGGEALEIHLGGGERPYRERIVQRGVDTAGRVRFGDLNGDGLSDVAIYDPRRPDSPIRLGINRGTLPGTPRAESLVAPPADRPGSSQP